MSKIEGGCRCGAVRYEMEAVLSVAVCHCRDCQYASGGGPNYIALTPKDMFRFTLGEPARYTRPGGSGAPVTRMFCATCGTPLISEVAMPIFAVKLGGLDDPAPYKPAAQIWTCDAPPWHRVDPAIPAFPENPPSR